MAPNKHSLFRPSGGLDSGRDGNRAEDEAGCPAVGGRVAGRLFSLAADRHHSVRGPLGGETGL